MEKIVAGERVMIAPGIVRITAPNPGVMTGPGTNTYIIGERELVVIDPGPAIDAHVAALRAAVGGRLKWILCTHTHIDHSPAARALKMETGARIGGRSAPQDGCQDTEFSPDRILDDGETVDADGVTLRAIRTPGHASNHVCYLLQEQRMLFTGDHVMQGSTVVISPPDGDMQAYLASLDKLLALDLGSLAPGHGRLIETPHDEVRRLVAHRLKRERKVFDALARKNPASVEELVPTAYDDVAERLYPVASRSLHAHLIKLAREGRASETASGWIPAGVSQL
jgi:glyoxylase-like metal-dependent hydrolase (beta-lactamase superfamily II)